MQTIEKRKFLFRMFYANKAFKQAWASCQHLNEHFFDVPDTVFESLITAIHIDYGRPFTMNYGAGKLTDEIIPARFLDLHLRILELRHQYFAHSDTGRLEHAEGVKVHNVFMTWNPPDFQIHVAGVNEPPLYYKRVNELLEVLVEKTHYHVHKTFSQFGRKNGWLRRGYWKLSIDPAEKEWWVRIPDAEWHAMMQRIERDGADSLAKYQLEVGPRLI